MAIQGPLRRAFSFAVTFPQKWSPKPAGFEEQGPQLWACGKSPRSRYERFGRRVMPRGDLGHFVFRGKNGGKAGIQW